MICKFYRLKKKFLGTTSAQVASSNHVLTGMGWGVQRGGGLVPGLTGKRPPCVAPYSRR